MHNTHQMPVVQKGSYEAPLSTGQTLTAIVNLRGDASNLEFLRAVTKALDIGLPTDPCTTVIKGDLRAVWVGPDDWFLIGMSGQSTQMIAKLRSCLAAQLCAITDVSSGYFVVSLSGSQARTVLQQGCPIDLHPRTFGAGKAVGSQFFKVGIHLWLAREAHFEMLVRRSFIDHFWQLIGQCTRFCGWETSRAA